ncbi:glycine zipper 2TM domain-containing protein [Piscinibacter sp. XHJ-5]|uniref:glycine zipper 2TM domain-containing protein n=1 Tax=Piscinibacter sp. XHJ-5 TaxID=3037797 RepID=UPI00245295B4|nr:glycine zipper 2TM domain-containing protein [Piscinibacter sp. XHJ-5]
MTSKLMTLSAVASALVLAAGCSSVSENTAPPASGTIGASPYSSSSSSTEAAQFGYVRNIQQHETARRSSGAGAILGAVIGGALGNQVGSGSGRTAATAIGAVGGAVAGNKIEENRSGGQAYYQVDVRLDNGDFRSFDYYDVNGLRVGDRVRVEGNQLQRW